MKNLKSEQILYDLGRILITQDLGCRSDQVVSGRKYRVPEESIIPFRHGRT